MTVAPNSPSSNVPQNKTEKLSLSATQVAASGLAAVSATVAASFFGVAGTVIGAALGSVISVVGSAVYSYSIRQTRQRVRQGLDVAVAQRFSVDHSTASEPEAAVTEKAVRRTAIKPRQLAAAAGVLFVVTMGVVTGFELLSGKPLSATVSGSHGTGGTTFDHSTTKSTLPSTTTPVTSGSASASTSSSSPTATVTLTQTQPSTPSSSAPSTSATSSEPSPSGTPSATPSTSPSG
jgi:hypothetical protein